MNNKKSILVWILAFLLIFAIIAILIMSYFLHKIYIENITLNQHNAELSNSIDNFQEKINEISNTLSSIKFDANTSDDKSNENKTDINTSTDKSSENKTDTGKKTSTIEAKYEFSSADNNAAKGYPEILKVYELTENELNFYYSSGRNFTTNTIDREITATAKSTSKNLYEFEENTSGHQYKLSFEFNDKNDMVTVHEYDNNNEMGHVNLWR